MSHPLFERHRKTLDAALDAIRTRRYFSAYPEVPSGKVYGETAKADGEAAFKARLGKPFKLDQPGAGAAGTVGGESSPFTGEPLGIRYPKPDLDKLLAAAQRGVAAWAKAGAEARTGVALEILKRLNARSFELANAIMHTTGQAFMMAFQAGGPHAQDRGLEAVAYAWDEMNRTPARATWEKQVSKTDVVRLEKRFHVVPRGIGAVIGCSTFPTWNGYPGLFASLVTGNAVVLKPHPGAILPLAITAEIARAVLAEQGFDPNLVTLAADDAAAPITKALVTRPEVRIVDYTGSSEFGTWVERNAPQAVVYTEKAGVNSAIIDSADDLKAMTGNIAFTVCLYSGQMCTTTRNIFIPAGGVEVGGQHKSYDEISKAIVGAIDWLLGDAARGAEILGAIQNEKTIERLEQARRGGGRVLREPAPVANAAFPKARVRSPLVLEIDAAKRDLYAKEAFGPIVHLIKTKSTAESIELAARGAREQGAITAAIYSTDAAVLEQAEDAMTAAGVALSCNLTGQIFVNQSAAFSDFHVSGANPAGNATLCDGAFVANRFRVVQSRVPAPVKAPRMPAYEFEGVRPVVDPTAYVHPAAVLIGDVIVGPGCLVGPGASLRGDIGRLVLMEGANVQDNCILHTFPGREVIVEADGHIGHGAILHGCIVKRNALVGMHAVIMDEAVIGEEAIVAAMAFVKAGTHVPPRTLVAGIPAKPIRELRPDEIQWKSDGTRIYQHLARRYLATARAVEPLRAVEPGRRRVPGVPYDAKPTPPAPPPPR